jgi:amino acid adenylation domain-containing protein
MVVDNHARASQRLSKSGGHYESRTIDSIGDAGYPLTLFAYGEEPFHIRLVYDPRVFGEAQMQRLITQLEELIVGYLDKPEITVAELSTLLCPAPLLSDWQSNEPVNLAHEILRRAADYGEQIALVDQTASWTYAELCEQVLHLAQALQRRGLTPGSLVAVHLDRTVDLVSTMLAIHLCNCSYPPLDINHPEAARSTTLREADCDWLIHDDSLNAPTRCSHSLSVDDLRNDPVDESSVVPIAMDHPAYVIFTSGSTGTPKGVAIDHASVINLVEDFVKRLEIDAHTRWLAVTTVSFDIHVLELFAPLWSGATVVLCQDAERRSGRELQRVIEQHEINYLQATPTTWQLLINSGWTGTQDMTALVGGEAWPGNLADMLSPRVQRLWNVYGPTESTVWSTAYEVIDPQAPLFIGLPIQGTDAVVLDAQERPVAPGMIGSLHIGGVGLAREYYRQPDLTAAKFRTHRFQERAHRLYDTGDLVRFHEDGLLEYVGRIDRQLKVRGHRIEPAAIETALSKLGFESSIVDHRQDHGLVAWIATRADEVADEQSVRADLGAVLPYYMVPSRIVCVRVIPLTLNDKRDVARLPDPPDRTDENVGDITALDRAILELWQAQLPGVSLGMDDDYFEAGGESLGALEILQEMEKLFERDISDTVLFANPTPAGFKRAIGANTKSSFSILPLNEADGTGNLFCVSGLTLYRSLAQVLEGRFKVYGTYTDRERQFNEGHFHNHEELISVAESYADLIQSKQAHGPYRVAGVSLAGVIALEAGRILQERGEEVERVFLFDTTLRSGIRYKGVDGFKKWLKRFGARGGLRTARKDIDWVRSSALDRYRPTSYSGAVLIFVAETGFGAGIERNTALGWDSVCSDLKAVRVKGTHLSILQGSNVAALSPWFDRG